MIVLFEGKMPEKKMISSYFPSRIKVYKNQDGSVNTDLSICNFNHSSVEKMSFNEFLNLDNRITYNMGTKFIIDFINYNLIYGMQTESYDSILSINYVDCVFSQSETK